MPDMLIGTIIFSCVSPVCYRHILTTKNVMIKNTLLPRVMSYFSAFFLYNKYTI